MAVAKKWVDTINPMHENAAERIHELTSDKGADVVFEVSGSKPGIETMTEAAAVRGRIVMVAIHGDKPQVDMFKFFWRELELLGPCMKALIMSWVSS